MLENSVDAIMKADLQLSLGKMKNRKSTGPDGISAELLKYGGDQIS